MEIIELKEINIERLRELYDTRDVRKQQEIDAAIEMVKRSEQLKETIRELDVEELKKIDALLYRGAQPATCTSIKASDLSDRGVNLYVAIVKGAHMLTLKECTHPTEEYRNYKKFIQELSEAGTNKDKKFEVASQAMLTLRKPDKASVNIFEQPLVETKEKAVKAK